MLSSDYCFRVCYYDLVKLCEAKSLLYGVFMSFMTAAVASSHVWKHEFDELWKIASENFFNIIINFHLRFTHKTASFLLLLLSLCHFTNIILLQQGISIYFAFLVNWVTHRNHISFVIYLIFYCSPLSHSSHSLDTCTQHNIYIFSAFF